ncbi:hypothetical protein F66182_7512 [Fusarium sp. NRRL 66182]|nr:hypothetical protein F66182_7512 [Fusarium sp. NRRL 66182]
MLWRSPLPTRQLITHANYKPSPKVQVSPTEEPSPLSTIPIRVLLRSVALTTVMANRWLLSPCLAFIALITQSKSAFLNPDKNPVLNRMLQWTIYNQFCAGNSIPEVKNTVKYIKNLGFHGIILGYSKDVVLDPSVELPQTDVEDYPAECYGMIDEWKRGNVETLGMIESGDLLVYNALSDICHETRRRGCQLWIDAEQQAMQPTLDDWTIRTESGLPTVAMKCAQIMGMADELSCKLLQDYRQAVKEGRATPETPRIYKCLPWGSVEERVNYLYRRAVENRGAVERTQHMAHAMRQELRRRILG